MKYDVLVLGGYFLDLIFTDLEDEPELGHEVFSNKFSMLPGGAYNTVATLHRLGVKVAWAANFGNDEFSQYVIKTALSDGLDPVCFSYSQKPCRNITISASYRGDREFISYSDPESLDLEYFQKVMDISSRIAFIGGLYTSRLLQVARNHFSNQGTILVMDGNSSSGTLKDKKIARSLKLVDIFMPNGCEARRLTGCQNIEDCLLNLGRHTDLVVIKEGESGSYAIKNETIYHAPALPIKKCLDTTGAGDCFDAGFIRAYLNNQDIDTCLKWGNIVGGLSTQGFGGSGYQITVDEVQKTLNKYVRK